jgi:hypothetical protein
MEKYLIKIDMYTEKNKGGKLSTYYLKGNSGSKVSIGGIALAKTYLNKRCAEKVCEKLKGIYSKDYVFVSVVTI